MLGHIMEWFYSGLGGIRSSPDAIASNKIEIRPEVVGNVNFVKANYQSPYGTIHSDWKKTADRLELNVTIPANTTAVIYIPANTNDSIISDGKNIIKNKTLKYIGRQGNKALVAVGSGNYTFVVKSGT